MCLAAASLRGTQEHGAFRRRPPAEALLRRLALSFPSSCALCAVRTRMRGLSLSFVLFRNGRPRVLRRGHKHARLARSGGVVRVCPGRGFFWWWEVAPRLCRAAARALAHKKQARRATRTAGAASCVAALVGLGRAAFRRSFSSLIAHRGPICVVLITAHWGLAPLIRGRGLLSFFLFPPRDKGARRASCAPRLT